MYKLNLIQRANICLVLLAFMAGLSCANAFQADTESTEDASDSAEVTQTSNIETDFTLPVTAASKQQSLDGKKRTSIFVENVVIRQGSLEILADRVEANASAGKGKEIILANGKPASYTQRLADGSIVSASANEIIYEVASRTISLKGNAAIKQNDVQVNGDSITFDMAKEQIIASSDENSDGPVTTVLSPGAFATPELPDDESDAAKQKDKQP